MVSISFHIQSKLLLLICISIISFVSCDIPTKIGDGHCIWYESCVKNPDKFGNKRLNCKYDSDAKKLEFLHVRKLRSICPYLVKEIEAEYGGTVKTCCSGFQIDDLIKQLNQLGMMIKSCPACYSNLKKNFCYFTCHPRHSSFMVAHELYTFERKNKTGKYNETAVKSVDHYMTETFINETYESCKNVHFSETIPALQVMCGKWGDKNCSPKRLFDYFGNNFMAPFDIYYHYGDKNTTVQSDQDTIAIKPFITETILCNTDDKQMTCSCKDCEASCKIDPDRDPETEDPNSYIYVGNLRLYVFLIILCYSLFVLALLIFVIVKKMPPALPEKSVGCGLCSFNHRISANFEKSLQNSFKKLFETVGHHPYLVLALGLVAIVILSSGITKLQLTTDPVELWASPDSRTRHEKDFFDQNFGPFYRTNQIIITGVDLESFTVTRNLKDDNITTQVNGVFNSTFMKKVMDLQLEIMNLSAQYENKTITMNDICIKPMEPSFEDCMIQSIMNYWQNDADYLMSMMVDENGEDITDYVDHFITCTLDPYFISEDKNCLGTYGGPVLPYVALGGFLDENETVSNFGTYQRSSAIIITILGQNYLDKSKLGPTMAWEEVFIQFMKNFSDPMMDLAFYSERGIEDEIIRESKGDLSTILISYFVMFTYVTISLGQPTADSKRLFIETKMTLGLCSVLLVFMAVVSAVGLCSYLGVKGTLFVIEVIPFLVLAIGVDNIYLMIQTWQKEEKKPEESVEAHVARSVSTIAPSMLLATASEAICFFLGAFSKMPAVHAFAIFAGVAVSIGFVLQITCLVAFMVLDAKRMKANRYDMICCASGPKSSKSVSRKHNICMDFFESFYAPLLFKDSIRISVMLFFVTCFSISFVYMPHVDVGLEQDVGMPKDSYMIKYFYFLGEYLSVGPPVYFVADRGFDFSDYDEQNLFCQGKDCDPYSLWSQIHYASRSPDKTSIATATNDWLNDYFIWISDGVMNNVELENACCRLDKNRNFINTSAPFAEEAKYTCLKNRNFDRKLERPKPSHFMDYLPSFLADNPHGIYCPKAGHPQFGSSVIIEETKENGTHVGPSNFMAYHTILKKSKDFTEALERTYGITEELNHYLRNNSKNENARVFPYSIFYVYYEQYLTMWSTTLKSLSMSFGAVYIVMIALSGLDIWSSTINLLIIFMIIVDIMGVMVIWSIQLNAISVVNLVMAVGISVEFCNHITHSFSLIATGTRKERATKALVNIGSSVLSGITLTKFAGIVVLAFATSNIITIYYFRMYLLIVLFGSVHGLVLLPVLLSLFGPEPNTYMKSEKEIETSEQQYDNETFSSE